MMIELLNANSTVITMFSSILSKNLTLTTKVFTFTFILRDIRFFPSFNSWIHSSSKQVIDKQKGKNTDTNQSAICADLGANKPSKKVPK
jgi:hypothetical protein